MPIVPNTAERLVLLRLNQAPGPLLDFVGALGFRTALAGFRLGVFDTLSAGAATSEQVAAGLDTDAVGMRPSCSMRAVALGYVRRRGDCYENTAMTVKWLPVVGEGVDFFVWAVDEWSHLEACVRDEDACNDKATWTPETWHVFENGMRAFARLSVGEVVVKLPVPPHAGRMLDLGGGHGLHSVELCRRHPASKRPSSTPPKPRRQYCGHCRAQVSSVAFGSVPATSSSTTWAPAMTSYSSATSFTAMEQTKTGS